MKKGIKKHWLKPMILVVALSGCTDSGSNSTTNTTPQVTKEPALVSIDVMSSVPVINGNSTTSALYIHNYSDKVVEGLQFGLGQQTIVSEVKSALARVGFDVSQSIDDKEGFRLIDPEKCQNIAPYGSCAIKFSTPTLSFGNQGNALVNLSYKNEAGSNITTSQIVNYEYIDGNTIPGVNFNGNLEVAGTTGSTRYAVGYMYAGGNSGSVYKNVNLVPNSQNVQINGGFINNQEVASDQVIAVEFAVAVQNSQPSFVSVEPTWGNTIVSNSIAATNNNGGTALGMSIVPGQSVVNYLFGNVPILEAQSGFNFTSTVVNNGNVNGGPLTVEKTGGTPDGITVNLSNCNSNPPRANALSSCTISYTVNSFSPGSTTLTFKDANNAVVGSQAVYWLNDRPFPMVKLTPSATQTVFDSGDTSDLVMFTVQNIGKAPLSNANLTSTVTGTASWNVGTNTCGDSLGVGSSCLIVGTLSDNADGQGLIYYTAKGSFSSEDFSFVSLPVRYFVGSSTPKLIVTPLAVVNVQLLANGESASQNTYTILNNGTATANLVNVALESMTTVQQPVISNQGTCTGESELAVNQSCTIIVTFGPESSSVTVSESGSTRLIVDYNGGTPSVNQKLISAAYNYSLVGNDTYVVESIEPGGFKGGLGTTESPLVGTSNDESMHVDLEYKNPSTTYPLTNFNINTNGLPFGMVINTATTTCPTGSQVATLPIGGSCVLEVDVSRELLTRSAQGGAVRLVLSSPEATWSTQLGFYKQTGDDVVIDYLQPTISFSLNRNNATFESTVLTMVLTNEVAGTSPFIANVGEISSWLESQPVAVTGNCTVASDKSASCTLSSDTSITGRIRYFMPNYLASGESATIPLIYNSNGFNYLSPRYNFIKYISN